MKGAIRQIFWLYTLLFLLLIGYLLKISLYDSNSFVANSMNPRLSQSNDGIKRGSILDINGTVIAESIQNDDGTYTRKYDSTGNYSHIVGYMVKGKSGIESKYNFRMETISMELFQRIGNVFFGKEIQGNNLVLTVDDRLQQLASKELGNSRGAIVAMEPDTGKILAMVSNPTFDSNTVEQDWSELNSDEENSPLLNRATQGLYPPGSTFKIISAAAAIEAGKEASAFEMDCEGEKKFGHSVLHCYDGKAHGHVDMTKAFAKSCNTYFASVVEKIGAPALISTANDFGFNADINFPLEYNKARFSLTKDSNINEIVETSIGQGKTLVTPLYMAMVTSAIANNGVMMQPYIVDHTETPSGGIRNKTLPVKLRQVCDASIAYDIKDMMCEVVKSGTAKDAAFSVSGKAEIISDDNTSGSSLSGSSIKIEKGAYSGEITVAGKTGTAENAGGEDHSWFVAFAPAEKPRIAVAVILENAGHGSRAIPDAREIMKEYIQNLEK